MSLEIFLLSMQAAGAIGDMIGTGSQQKTIRKGAQVQQENIATSIEEQRLASSLAAVDSMKALRQVLASQRAIFGARGTNPGVGSAAAVGATSLHEHSVDERIRRINLLSREHNLRAQSALAGLHAIAGETQLGQALTNRLFQQIPFSELAKSVGEKKPTTTTSTPTSSIGQVNKGK